MKRLLSFLCLILLFAGAAKAHQGMIAFYADTVTASCSTDIGVGQLGYLSAYYDRGDGPLVGNAYEFRALKSSPDVIFMEPIFYENVAVLGTIDVDIAFAFNYCMSPGNRYRLLLTLPVFNMADPDTFTVRVVKALQTQPPDILTVLCDVWRTKYSVAGGWFVVNGECGSVGDPWPVAVQNKSWGAIKNLYR